MGTLEVQTTVIGGVLIISPQIFRDQRGFFVEMYNVEDFADIGISEHFFQDNYSRSQKGVLRGLHYQYPHPQGKLVRAIRGRIFDVVVDIRAGSPTYGKYYGIILTGDSHMMLYVPIGCAHGYLALEDDTEVMYKVTDLYHPESDGGLTWNDPDLGIIWPYQESGIVYPILSEKDIRLPAFRDLKTPFEYESPV